MQTALAALGLNLESRELEKSLQVVLWFAAATIIALSAIAALSLLLWIALLSFELRFAASEL